MRTTTYGATVIDNKVIHPGVPVIYGEPITPDLATALYDAGLARGAYRPSLAARLRRLRFRLGRFIPRREAYTIIGRGETVTFYRWRLEWWERLLCRRTWRMR